MQHLPSITFHYLSILSLILCVCLLIPAYGLFWQDLEKTSDDFSLFLHIFPLSRSFLSLRIAFSSLPYSSFYPPKPSMLSLTQFYLFFSLKSPLSSVQLLPSHPPSFPAPVEYYRMFSLLPPTLSSLRSFSLSKISPWYPSFIPPFFSRPAVLYSFFSLAAHSRFLLSFHSHLW